MCCLKAGGKIVRPRQTAPAFKFSSSCGVSTAGIKLAAAADG